MFPPVLDPGGPPIRTGNSPEVVVFQIKFD